jgi:hypothetical protein
MARIKWSKERVIEEIQKSYGSKQTSRNEKRRLREAARKHFGSMEQALLASGVERLYRKWSRGRVVQHIQAEYPHLGAKIWHDMAFAQTIYTFFRTRSEALLAAGFEGGRQKWTPERIVKSLQAHGRQNSLKGITTSAPYLYRAACRLFGDWTQALRAAGLENPNRRWTKSAVLAAIRKRQQLGQPLHDAWRCDPCLFGASKRLFGGWRNALRAAGIPVSIPRTWTRKRVLTALKALRNKRVFGGGTQVPSFYEPAVRYFGSWSAALATVGLTYTPHQVWSKERVLSETRVWYRRTGGDRSQLSPALLGAMRRYWGGLTKTLEAAGLESHVIRKWSKSLIIQEIQNRHIAGQPIQRPCDVEPALASAARTHFGSWQQALEASGLDSEIPDHRRLQTPTDCVDSCPSGGRAKSFLRGFRAGGSGAAALRRRVRTNLRSVSR